MKPTKYLAVTVTLLVMLSLGLSAASAQPKYDYFPTSSVTDGRFLAVAGIGVGTLVNQPTQFYIVVPAGETTFEIGIFDGDTRGIDANGKEHWDARNASTQLIYELYADPGKTGGGTPVGTWYGNDDAMPDNDWYNIGVSTDSAAREPDGSYTYRLSASLQYPNTVVISNFKVRTTGSLVLAANTPFAYEAAVRLQPELHIVYPNLPDGWNHGDPWEDWYGENSTYDGTWTFLLNVTAEEVEINEITIWDGDLDRVDDDDDLNTDSEPFLPDFVVGPPWPKYEGTNPGMPADDIFYEPFLRAPSIYYELRAPDGTWTCTNSNPSGDSEWERFVIRTYSHPYGYEADCNMDSLQPGIYTLTIRGVDLFNLGALYFEYEVAGASSVGDFVWEDTNKNGIQDGGEPGIGGVLVKLYREGVQVDETTTDSNGWYEFITESDTYTVKIDESNFTQGSALEGMSFSPIDQGGDDTLDSDGGPNHEATLTLGAGEHNKTIDFGFFESGGGGQGCTPGFWKQKHHFRFWVNYDPYDDLYNDVFGVGPDITLIRALWTGGGGERALWRHSVAALLNAASPDVDYLYTELVVISLVQYAYATGEFEEIKNLFEVQNELACSVKSCPRKCCPKPKHCKRKPCKRD